MKLKDLIVGESYFCYTKNEQIIVLIKDRCVHKEFGTLTFADVLDFNKEMETRFCIFNTNISLETSVMAESDFEPFQRKKFDQLKKITQTFFNSSSILRNEQPHER